MLTLHDPLGHQLAVLPEGMHLDYAILEAKRLFRIHPSLAWIDIKHNGQGLLILSVTREMVQV